MSDIERKQPPAEAIAKGMLFKSNDPRDRGRGVYQVDVVIDGKAVLVRSRGDWTRVSVKRLYQDGIPRKSGWRDEFMVKRAEVMA